VSPRTDFVKELHPASYDAIICRILTVLPLPYPKEPPFISTVLLTAGCMGYPRAGYARDSFLIRCVHRIRKESLAHRIRKESSPVTTNHAANGSVFVNLRNGGNLKIGAHPAGSVPASGERVRGLVRGGVVPFLPALRPHVNPEPHPSFIINILFITLTCNCIPLRSSSCSTSTPPTRHPQPLTLDPTPCPHPTPHTLHPTPYTLHPTTYTLPRTTYPTPFILNHKP